MSAYQTAKAIVRARYLSQVVATFAYKATAEINAQITIAVDGTANTFTDSASGLSVFANSKHVIVSGFTESANNGLFTVKHGAVTAGVLPVAETTLTTEALGDAVTIATALPVQYENDKTFVQPEQSLFTRLTFHTLSDVLLEVGAGNVIRYNAQAWLEMYAPQGTGDKALNDLADASVNAFINSTTKKPVITGGVKYGIPQLIEVGIQEDFFRTDLHIPFQYDY